MPVVCGMSKIVLVLLAISISWLRKIRCTDDVLLELLLCQVVGVAAISLETADLTPDSVDKILGHKSVKEKQAEYTNKLDALRKKKRKEMGKLQEKLLRTPSKPKNPLGMIKKKFSTPNLESSLSASPPSATPEEV